jgi:predicted PhzF superfamily epimerase YddE/YHI9
MCVMLACGSAICAAQGDVRLEPTHLQGPRPLQEQTRSAVVRDYLQGWKTLSTALEQNDPNLLNRDFAGTALDKLAAAVKQQSAAGIRTRYQDKSHDIQIVFYSPEGLSIELTDDVQYDVQVLDHDKVQTTQQVHAHYIVVLTPAEVRWRVRVFQAQFE